MVGGGLLANVKETEAGWLRWVIQICKRTSAYLPVLKFRTYLMTIWDVINICDCPRNRGLQIRIDLVAWKNRDYPRIARNLLNPLVHLYDLFNHSYSDILHDNLWKQKQCCLITIHLPPYVQSTPHKQSSFVFFLLLCSWSHLRLTKHTWASHERHEGKCLPFPYHAFESKDWCWS